MPITTNRGAVTTRPVSATTMSTARVRCGIRRSRQRGSTASTGTPETRRTTRRRSNSWNMRGTTPIAMPSERHSPHDLDHGAVAPRRVGEDHRVGPVGADQARDVGEIAEHRVIQHPDRPRILVGEADHLQPGLRGERASHVPPDLAGPHDQHAHRALAQPHGQQTPQHGCDERSDCDGGGRLHGVEPPAEVVVHDREDQHERKQRRRSQSGVARHATERAPFRRALARVEHEREDGDETPDESGFEQPLSGQGGTRRQR